MTSVRAAWPHTMQTQLPLTIFMGFPQRGHTRYTTLNLTGPTPELACRRAG